LQGEGQEFESPRLHHLAGGQQIEDLGTTRAGDTTQRVDGRRDAIEPLIRVLLSSRPPTSGSLGERSVSAPRSETHLGGSHLNNWIVFGRNEEIFDFAE
jgi:hypothetical protein